MADEIIDGGDADTEFSTIDGVIDYTSPLGQIRLLITDVSDVPAERLFTDAQLNVFYQLRGENVNRAAARALTVIAASEVLVGKVIRNQAGQSTDGAKVSAELRALAATYEAEADGADAAASGGFFEVVPLYGSAKPEGAEWRL
ncbi:hypothetical protein [Arthrobacter sp. SAFR-014]|uniref:hypothetical protein n=1 Tax=unclassified Arthrobacter TaxID=235627 RepID=UPI003F7B5632